MGRIERSFENGDRRYHKILPSLSTLQNLYTQIFVESYDTPPEHIILDIDATDIITHGHQERGCFNGYYEQRCFLPLYIYCGPHLLLAQLRPGNADPGKRAKKEIKRLIIQIRQYWPAVKILVRGDSGFTRKNLMNWCEANDVDYIFGLARNSYLLHKARKIRSRAALSLVQTKQTVMMFGHFNHRPRSKTWRRPRHIIAKVLHKLGYEQRCRFLVTSLDWDNPLVIGKMKQASQTLKKEKCAPTKDLMPRVIYDKIYCPRGDMENRIKDCQLDLFGDRTSAHDYRANQLRLILAGFAYVLTTYIRLKALAKTSLAKASPNTIRLKLFKIGAKVSTSLRRIKISMPDAYPYKQIFFTAWQALAPT